MTMSPFSELELLSGIKVGDKVGFEVTWGHNAGMVAMIAKSGWTGGSGNR
ncbi:hypothetical protein PX699_10260 [Sphingobium sp. H39-3-25]|nr:hypothetical protein [Sphingobium arseniciresistens]